MILYVVLCALLLATLAILLLPLWKDGHKRFVFAIGASFFVAAFGLYAWLGAPRIMPLLALRQEKLLELKKNILSRSEAVKKNPKDLAAWVELGQDFMETGQYPAAANAFKQSVLLSSGNPLLIMAYAQALILGADGKVTDEAKKSLDMVILQQPQNPEARYYLAVRQLQDGHTQEAMKEMKELYHSLPNNSPLKAMINMEIGK
jgi:cytochrome c-type biogenesis protein CcmH